MSRSNPDLAPSTATAEACPVCGGPAAIVCDALANQMFARCPPCDTDWLPLAEWNSPKLQLVPASEGGVNSIVFRVWENGGNYKAVSDFCGAQPPCPCSDADNCQACNSRCFAFIAADGCRVYADDGDRIERRKDGLHLIKGSESIDLRTPRGAMTVLTAEQAPADTMPRADGPDLLRDFTKQANSLIQGVETLTVTSVEQETEMELARTTLKAVVKLRNLVDKKRKEVGLEALRRKQKVDSEFGKVIIRLESEEVRLEKIATFKTRQLADARMRRQQEREDILKPWVDNVFSMDLADLPEDVFNRVRDSYEADFYAKQDRERQERLAAEEAERARKLEVQRLTNELAQAETERLRVAEVARVETARLQALADAATLDADILRKAQERLATARQTAQQGTDAQKLEEIARRLDHPTWPVLGEPWAHDIIHDEHVRLTLAGLAVWIRGQIKEHQPK